MRARSEFSAAGEAGPPLARLDWVLLLAVGTIAAMGWIALRGGAEGNAVLMAAAQRQLMWIGLGGAVILVAQFFDYQKISKFVPWLYLLNLAALVAVLVLGARVKGSRAWFDVGPFRFQPSETMKIVVAMALAQWFALRPEGISTFRDLITPGIIVGVPIGLVLLQPDLGTALVFGVLFLAILFWSGVPKKIIGAIIAAALMVAAAGFPFLKPYQKERILVFLETDRDLKGTGYNVLQSKIAIGAGGIAGEGWKEGTQTTLRFLPEHHTDFIFASLAEQFGLLGGLVAIGLFVLVGARMLMALEGARDRHGSLIVAGMGSIFMFHALFNIAMTLGMAPVTGLPLPLMSYGGSFMLATSLMIGLVVNVGSRRFLFG